MNLTNLERDLISEVGLESLQAKVYLTVNCNGMMSSKAIAGKLNIADEVASRTVRELMELGAFIDMPNDEFEAMHPRFTAVCMYRNYCRKKGIKFGQNKTVDNIGVVLEKPYEDARTK